jgi:cysteinyl-tRNA synthetase
MNITDVGHLVSDADDGEDKLEKGARREGKSAWDVAKYYGDYFVDGLKRLNISDPTYLPKATDHIQEQIDLIKQLEEKGFTYQTSDGIYYDTAKFPKYADFAKLDLDEQQAGARV